MTKYLITFVAAAALAACGSAPAPAPTAPVEPDHAAHHGAGSASEPATPDATPAQPAAPAEPSRPDPAKQKAALLAAETAGWETAKPAFEKACATCHTKAGKKAAKKKLDHFDMTTYPIGGHHTATIGFSIRDVLGLSGKKPTMPFNKPGSVQGDDLANIKAWTDAWEAADRGGAHAAAAATHAP